MRGADSLETVTLGLDTPVLSRHVHHGRINVNCTASVANAYWESRIESAAVHVAQKLAVLESIDMRNSATGEYAILFLLSNVFITILLFTGRRLVQRHRPATVVMMHSQSDRAAAVTASR